MIGILIPCLTALLCGCAGAAATRAEQPALTTGAGAETMKQTYTENTKISDVIHDPAFGNYGRLIFPVDSGYYSGDTLGDLRLTWYNNIDLAKTVEIANYLKNRASSGETVFYDIYTGAEKKADPAKENTGLFFFKGTPGARFAVCNAGGGFAYVGAMHDSFPHALELSKMGYNAFVILSISVDTFHARKLTLRQWHSLWKCNAALS